MMMMMTMMMRRVASSSSNHRTYSRQLTSSGSGVTAAAGDVRGRTASGCRSGSDIGFSPQLKYACSSSATCAQHLNAQTDRRVHWHYFHRLTTLIIHHPSTQILHSRLKTFPFCKSFPPQPFFSSSGLTPWIPRTVY